MPHCIICNTTSVLAYQYVCATCAPLPIPEGTHCHTCGEPVSQIGAKKCASVKYYGSDKCQSKMAQMVRSGKAVKQKAEKNRKPETDFDGEVSNFAKAIFNNHGSGPVKRYRPGDPGFEELAKQYQHPSRIKSGTKANYQGDFVARKAA